MKLNIIALFLEIAIPLRGGQVIRQLPPRMSTPQHLLIHCACIKKQILVVKGFSISSPTYRENQICSFVFFNAP